MKPASGDALRAEFEGAIDELRKLAKKKRHPTRLHARAVLLPMGRLLLAEEQAEFRDPIKRLAIAAGASGEAWERAVREELTLACTEHIQGVDPRFLSHARFDFEYVVNARERLEARLAAASALDLSPPEEMLDRVAAADRLLEPHLRTGDRPDPG